MLKSLVASILALLSATFGIFHSNPATPVATAHSAIVRQQPAPQTASAALAVSDTAPQQQPAPARSSTVTQPLQAVSGGGGVSISSQSPRTQSPQDNTFDQQYVTKQDLSGLLTQFGRVVSLLPQTATGNFVTHDFLDLQTAATYNGVYNSLRGFLPLGGGTLTGNLAVHGVTGLAAGDIPDLSASYLSTKGGTIAGDLTVTGSFSGGALSLADASSTLVSITGSWWVPQTSSLLLTDANGKVGIASTQTCTNQFMRSITGAFSATCATVQNTDLAHSTLVLNGTTVTLGDSGDTITAASSTLLTDNNTFSGTNVFSNPLSLTSTTGTTTIAAGQGFTIGTNQFVVQQGSGNVGIGTAILNAAKFAVALASASVADSFTDLGRIATLNGVVEQSGQLSLLQSSCGSYTVVGLDGLTYGTVLGEDGKCWFDRNLGATQVATAYNDSSSYGDLYQWGRLKDGHQVTTSVTTTTLSSTDVPGNSDFILASASPYDWRSPQNDSLWGSPSRTNNVCPAGWHVPTQTEWATWTNAAGLTSGAGSGSSGTTLCGSSCLAAAYNTKLKLPSAGYRDNGSGSLYTQGGSGLYWSSSPSGTNASYLYFYLTVVASTYTIDRAYGFSVRCLQGS